MKRYLPLLIAILIYAGLAFYQIRLPGLHHDEAQEAALMGMQLNNGLPPVLFRNTGLNFAGRAWPLMVQDYIGALNVYLAWIAFAIGGVSVESLRTMTILTGIVTLITAFGAARSLAGQKAGALTVLLLAVHPTYIFWTRQGVYVTSYTQTLALASLWLMVRWWKGGKAHNLYLAAFLMGIGLWGKLLFIWFMGAVFIAWLLLNLPRWIQLTRHTPRNAGLTSEDVKSGVLRPTLPTKWHTILIAILCGILGLLPLILYNLKSGGTLENIFGNLDQSYYGVDNSNVGENFRERIRQAPLVFESGHMWELGGQHPNPIAREWLYLTGGACIVAALITQEKRGVRLFIVLLVLLMVAQSSFTSTALWFTHFALILPFMVMLGAVGALALLDILRKFLPVNFTYGILAALVVLVFALDGLSAYQYHRSLQKTGGLRTHSDAIYRLVDTLNQLPPYSPVAALDWGISPVTETLTDGKIVPNEVFGYASMTEADSGFSARLAPFFALDESLYILHVPSETVFQRREAFFQAANQANREVVLMETIYTKTGDPYFEIWSNP